MKKKIGLFGAVSTGVGMLIATSCFISLADGTSQVGTPFIFAIILVCIVNMFAALSIAELNAIMPNLTGGIAQYTLAGLGPLITIVTMVGGYLISNVFAAPAEGAMFSGVMNEMLGNSIPPAVFSVGLTIILIIVNLMGVNMSTLVQSIVAAFMVGSLLVFGIIGSCKLGMADIIQQPAAISTSMKDVMPLTATAFWLFIGSEFIVPLGKDMKNSKRNVPLSMVLSLAIMCLVQVLMAIGFKNYTSWEELGLSDSPHVILAISLLGRFGRYWIIAVAIFAAVSTQNSIICSVSEICCGMAKINLLPAIFQKKNKHGAPYFVILMLGIITIIIEASGISTGEQVSFLTLTCSLFWMLSYIVSHINVIVLRKKMKHVPRSFKTPLFPLMQVVGIGVTVYMMYNISTDPTKRLHIYLLCLALFIGLFIYAFFWVKYKMKMPLLKSVGVHQVMAMENPLYHEVRNKIEKTEMERIQNDK